MRESFFGEKSIATKGNFTSINLNVSEFLQFIEITVLFAVILLVSRMECWARSEALAL